MFQKSKYLEQNLCLTKGKQYNKNEEEFRQTHWGPEKEKAF